jgi:hypothetical protein
MNNYGKKEQMNCKVCDSKEVVWSGTDAFVLVVPTEKVCYLCANTYALVKEVIDKDKE